MLLTAEAIKKYIECELETLNKTILDPKVDQETKNNAIQIEQVLFTIQSGIEHKKDEAVFAEWNEMFGSTKARRFKLGEAVITVDGFIGRILEINDENAVIEFKSPNEDIFKTHSKSIPLELIRKL